MAEPTRQRPKWFRALGHRDTPKSIETDGEAFDLVRIYKHDSWAATALYENADRQVVCKFNREQSVFGLPARWIGLFLAGRETKMLQLLQDVANVPDPCGPVRVQGKIVRTAAAHYYIEGQPLSWYSEVDESLLESLLGTVQAMHARNMAYVDLHKLENVIVDPTGQPHLIDFQISVRMWNVFPFSVLLGILQQSDLYHLEKHRVRFGPDPEAPMVRPWWIRAHRCIAVPFRTARRRLLTWMGVRQKGRANSEQFVEEGLSRKPSPDELGAGRAA